MTKLERLQRIVSGMGSAVIAYSGGVDSAFLLKVASGVLQDKVLAVTAVSPTYPRQELIHAKKMAAALKVRHATIKTREFNDKRFTANPWNRCYFCKRELFARLQAIARKQGLRHVIDASTLSDKKDFRPGDKAKKELGVRSPLQEAGFTKADIRRYSKKLGLATWDKPSLACLASRLPYGVRITPTLLRRINQAEIFLRTLGIAQVRLRHYNGLCRIEVPRNEIPRLLAQRQLVVAKLKKLGYNYITVDLQGYRTGSMNEVTT